MENKDFRLSLWNWVVIFCKGKFGGGLTSVLEYLLDDILNKEVLSKVSPDRMKKYSGLIVALADFGDKVLDLYVVNEAKRFALTKTVSTLRKVAVAIADGKVTNDEMELAIEDLVETIKAWKSLRDIKTKNIIMTPEIAETFVPPVD